MHAPALSCCSSPVSRRFFRSSFPLRKSLEDLVHLLSRKGLESLRLGVSQHPQGQRQAGHGFVIGGIDHQHEVIAPHCPEDLPYLHSRLFRHLPETLRTFGCFLHIPDPLVRQLDQADIGRHRSSPFQVFSMRGWLSFRHQRSVPRYYFPVTASFPASNAALPSVE